MFQYNAKYAQTSIFKGEVKMKRILTSILVVLLMMSTTAVSVGSAEDNAVSVSDGTTISFNTTPALYAHGILNSADTEAWQSWQSEHTTNLKEANSSVKYFFLPVSADNSKADIYNGYSEPVTVNGTEIAAGKTAQINYEFGKSYSVTADNKTYTLKFMKSNAEAGIYINNSDADGNGTNLMTYLNKDKSRSAAATGAIVEPDGSVDNTSIKKIKGRGNTTWTMPKKSYNITYSDNVSIAGMSKSKKYSILANYQDDSLSRNRFLYDLSDAVGMPYASDSRYVDFYVNDFLYTYLGNPDKYLYNSEYNELKVCATKAQLVALNEDPNGYCIDYFASNSGFEYGFVDGDLADRVNNASPNQKFNAVILLYDFDKESFSFNPQRNRIIKNYFSNTSRYDYDDFQGCIFITATKEQLLALNESDEHIRISEFSDE